VCASLYSFLAGISELSIIFISSFHLYSLEWLSLIEPARQVEKRVFVKDSLVEIKCEAVGFPMPRVTLWFENNLIEPQRSSIQVAKVSRTQFVDESIAGRYQCNAVGYYLSPNGGYAIHSAVKYIDVEVIGELFPHIFVDRVCALVLKKRVLISFFSLSLPLP